MALQSAHKVKQTQEKIRESSIHRLLSIFNEAEQGRDVLPQISTPRRVLPQPESILQLVLLEPYDFSADNTFVAAQNAHSAKPNISVKSGQDISEAHTGLTKRLFDHEEGLADRKEVTSQKNPTNKLSHISQKKTASKQFTAAQMTTLHNTNSAPQKSKIGVSEGTNKLLAKIPVAAKTSPDKKQRRETRKIKLNQRNDSVNKASRAKKSDTDLPQSARIQDRVIAGPLPRVDLQHASSRNTGTRSTQINKYNIGHKGLEQTVSAFESTNSHTSRGPPLNRRRGRPKLQNLRQDDMHNAVEVVTESQHSISLSTGSSRLRKGTPARKMTDLAHSMRSKRIVAASYARLLSQCAAGGDTLNIIGWRACVQAGHNTPTSSVVFEPRD